jgi:hypothetical protein
MRYIPKHFAAYELLPKDLYTLHGDNGLFLIDDRILWTLDKIREFFNKSITVNNWKSGGQFGQRGYRNDPGTGAPYSAHRFGRAVDFDIFGMTAEQFRSQVKDGSIKNDILVYITRIEDGVNWIHMDCMGLPKTPEQQIEFFHV